MAWTSGRPEKPLHWMGSAKKDLLEFPDDVVDEFGFALGVVQEGRTPASVKPWKGEGPGVFELVEDRRGSRRPESEPLRRT